MNRGPLELVAMDMVPQYGQNVKSLGWFGFQRFGSGEKTSPPAPLLGKDEGSQIGGRAIEASPRRIIHRGEFSISWWGRGGLGILESPYAHSKYNRKR